MKTKIFLLVCLFSNFTLNQLSAQNGKNGTGTLPFIETITGNNFEISIMCGGEEVDILNFPISYDLRIRHHFNNGELNWEKYQLNNVLYTSKISGEIFKAVDFEKTNGKGQFIWLLHLKGDKGNQYNIRMVFDTTTWELIDYRANCH